MARQYTKVQGLLEIVIARHSKGETYREIGNSYGLSKKQIKELVTREKRKRRKIAAGYVLRPKGRPRKAAADAEVSKDKEIVELKMQVELLRNFLLEVGRR